MSLALAHKRRVLEEQAKKPAPNPAGDKNFARKASGMNAAETRKLDEVKSQLDGDLMTLSKLNGDEEKTPFKKDLIEKYRALCEQLMQSHQNWARLKVLFWWFMWRLDVEGFEAVQADWYHGIESGLTTPDSFSRDWQTIYLDALHNFAKDNVENPTDEQLNYLAIATAELESGLMVTNAPLKAKLYKVYGQTLEAKGYADQAVNAYKNALELDDKVGVKKVIAQLEKELKTDE
ncbi:MAG: hypothetical protein HUJ13_03355 [Hydrogenovibrio crunogenus]|nr:hypothetical protein [Hydrogenovibrio crunogenus]